MAQRVVAALWRFDSTSLEDLQRIVDQMIRTKKTYERMQTDSVRRAGQLQLDYTVKGEKAVEVPSSRVRDNGVTEMTPGDVGAANSDG